MSENNSPLEIRELDPKSQEKLAKIKYNAGSNNYKFKQVGSKKYCYPPNSEQYASEMYNFQPKSDDIWLLGFFRTGTTVTQELIWLICNNLDFDRAKSVSSTFRFPSLEHVMYTVLDVINEDQKQGMRKCWDLLQNQTGQRFIKTHIPFSCLNENILTCGCKIIYTVRHPREVIVSNFQLIKQNSDTQMSFSDYWYCFKNDFVYFTPLAEHVREALARRQNENVLIIFYHEIVEGKKSVIRKIAKFLGKSLSEIEVDKLNQHLENNTFQKSLNMFTGAHERAAVKYEKDEDKWRRYFVGDLEQEFNDWIEDKFKGIDFNDVTK